MIKLDKLKKYFYINKKDIIFFGVIFIIALISGSIFSVILNENDKLLVTNHLVNFFKNIDKINYFNEFKGSIIINYCFIMLIWFLGFSVIGIPLMLFFYFIKSFIIGFSIGSILINYKLKGILMSLFYILPHTLIYMFIYLLLITYAIGVSKKLIYCVMYKKSMDFKLIINKYAKILLISVLVITLSIAYESFLLPKIFNILT